MAYEMWNYVSDLVADYTTVLDISPHKILTEAADKKQKIYEYDDGSIDVASYSNTTFFNVTLQWDAITEAEAGLIMELYHTSTKANGRERTFYITLPDTKTYTVRFLGPLNRSVTTNLMAAGRRAIAQVTLRVEGRKPA